ELREVPHRARRQGAQALPADGQAGGPRIDAGYCRRALKRAPAEKHVAQFEFAILGAGAMGSIVGAHLTRAGHEVAMLARGARAQQLRERGITISGLSDFTTAVTTVSDP